MCIIPPAPPPLPILHPLQLPPQLQVPGPPQKSRVEQQRPRPQLVSQRQQPLRQLNTTSKQQQQQQQPHVDVHVQQQQQQQQAPHSTLFRNFFFLLATVVAAAHAAINTSA